MRNTNYTSIAGCTWINLSSPGTHIILLKLVQYIIITKRTKINVICNISKRPDMKLEN